MNYLSSIDYTCVQGSNLLIRHVFPRYNLDDADASAFLEYYTTNNFLDDYNGNLFGVYSLNFSSNEPGIDAGASMGIRSPLNFLVHILGLLF